MCRVSRFSLKFTRYLTRILSLILVNLGFIARTGIIHPFLFCYACPLASTACPVGVIQNFVAMGRLPLYPLGFLALVFGFFGRSPCGLLCPFGWFQDCMANLGRKLGLKRGTPRLKGSSRYLTPVIVVLVAVITGLPAFCLICPAATLFAIIPWLAVGKIVSFTTWVIVHFIVLLAVTASSLLLGRVWCKYFCPLAFSGVFNRLSLFTLSFNPEKCKRCNLCLLNCPMGIKRPEDIGSSPDCVLCMKCVEICPNNAVEIRFRLR